MDNNRMDVTAVPTDPGDGVATDTCTWPFPVQCVPGDGAEQILAEYCKIALREDRKLSGTLVSFTPARRTLTVLGGHSVSLEKLDFEDILMLRLPRPVAIQRPQQRLTTDATRPLTQPYSLTLTDGVSLSGETIGSIEDEAGLYLFQPVDTDSIERRFHPHSAMRSQQVGGLLGEILLESNQVSRGDLQSALHEQHQQRGQRLGELLEKSRAINREDLAVALKRQESMLVMVRLVSKIMLDASVQRATDIHIENYPGKHDTCVRFRRDGALYDYLNIPYRFRNAIVSRIKIISGLDISEKRSPQDGKLEFTLPGAAKLELSVATIPTANGLEDIVMRLLSGATLRSLEHIGMDERLTGELRRLVAKPYGMLTLKQNGIDKIIDGHTDLKQVRAVCG